MRILALSFILFTTLNCNNSSNNDQKNGPTEVTPTQYVPADGETLVKYLPQGSLIEVTEDIEIRSYDRLDFGTFSFNKGHALGIYDRNFLRKHGHKICTFAMDDENRAAFERSKNYGKLLEMGTKIQILSFGIPGRSYERLEINLGSPKFYQLSLAKTNYTVKETEKECFDYKIRFLVPKK